MEQNLQRADPYRIEAVDRALRLLTLLTERSQLSVTEAAHFLEVAPSTAHRLLTTLAGRGFAAQGEKRLYRTGPALLAAGAATRSVPAITARLHPLLQDVHDEVGETVHLQILVGADAQFVDGIEGRQALRVGLRTGTRIPAYCTSGGKAMLAALPDPTIEALHSGGLRPWPSRRISTLRELSAEIAAVRDRGYGLNTEESEAGVTALGVAVRLGGEDPVASISVATPTTRMDESARRHAVERLRRARDDAERALRGE
ncbi:IclR family transcriptional regulator [Brachybacterium kimchii]|uniref:IclR family transcriptional regulator n=1 Tax=Brachybacterium kimchii TaxID=2942909 RepID=A0ABY4N5B3_9MICO|nr:IclR family transcriptional regulator [Brachybacterium kimchii]UQN28972.1 IclR family transcriptional regulator [Brachybacterium kimchii]